MKYNVLMFLQHGLYTYRIYTFISSNTEELYFTPAPIMIYSFGKTLLTRNRSGMMLVLQGIELQELVRINVFEVKICQK